MKKRMIIITLLLMTMVNIQAQSLLGTWKTTMTVDGDVMMCNLSFSAGQKTTLKMEQVMNFDEMGVFELTITFPGTYIMKDKTITMNLNTQSFDCKFTKMQFGSEFEKMFKEMPELRKMCDDELNKALEEVKKNLRGGVPIDGDMEILSLTNTILKLQTGDDVLTFEREVSTPQTSSKSEAAPEYSGTVYELAETMPSFPGGSNALSQFIANNLKYPVVCEENRIQGRVICTFIVETDGSISNIKVVKNVDPALDKEAKRVLSLMPKWIPGRDKGQLVRVKYTVPISFRLQ